MDTEKPDQKFNELLDKMAYAIAEEISDDVCDSHDIHEFIAGLVGLTPDELEDLDLEDPKHDKVHHLQFVIATIIVTRIPKYLRQGLLGEENPDFIAPTVGNSDLRELMQESGQGLQSDTGNAHNNQA